MRGTGYVIAEIGVWMIGSALIGVFVGWLIRGWRREKKLRQSIEMSVEHGSDTAELATKLAETEAERSELRTTNEHLVARIAELETRLEVTPSGDDDAGAVASPDDEPPGAGAAGDSPEGADVTPGIEEEESPSVG